MTEKEIQVLKEIHEAASKWEFTVKHSCRFGMFCVELNFNPQQWIICYEQINEFMRSIDKRYDVGFMNEGSDYIIVFD